MTWLIFSYVPRKAGSGLRAPRAPCRVAITNRSGHWYVLLIRSTHNLTDSKYMAVSKYIHTSHRNRQTDSTQTHTADIPPPTKGLVCNRDE